MQEEGRERILRPVPPGDRAGGRPAEKRPLAGQTGAEGTGPHAGIPGASGGREGPP